MVLAQFIPILRTFAPVVAGVGEMGYRRFATYNVLGAILWVTSMTLAGYVLGNLVPNIEERIHLVVARSSPCRCCPRPSPGCGAAEAEVSRGRGDDASTCQRRHHAGRDVRGRPHAGRLVGQDETITSPETGLAYRIGRLLGQGGFGQVYLATRLGRSTAVPATVCIKVSSHINGWLREAYFGQLLGDTLARSGSTTPFR